MPVTLWTDYYHRLYMHTKETDIDKQFYKIKDVAEIIGVPQSTLRFWEAEFPEICPARGLGNFRRYTRADIEKLHAVHYLVKMRGLKIDAARRQLKTNLRAINSEMDTIRRLETVREEMKQLLKAFSKREQDKIFVDSTNNTPS